MPHDDIELHIMDGSTLSTGNHMKRRGNHFTEMVVDHKTEAGFQKEGPPHVPNISASALRPVLVITCGLLHCVYAHSNHHFTKNDDEFQNNSQMSHKRAIMSFAKQMLGISGASHPSAY
jgi:hypothetical protein